MLKSIRSTGFCFFLPLVAFNLAYADEFIIPAPPQIEAEGYFVMDANTDEVLVEFNSDQRLAPASLTKIMTSYVAAKELSKGSISLDDEVSVSVKAWRMEGSRMFIREGTTVRLEDILRGIIVQSGNDASVALAEHISGSEESFVETMNMHARNLGLKNTNFENSTGLPNENHYTTASDLGRLVKALIREFPSHYKYYAEKSYEYAGIRQNNRNRLLWRDASVDGVKTGHTKAAGYCLVASAVRSGMRLISVVMGTESEISRAIESQKLLSFGFRYFETISLYQAGDILRQVKIWGGKHNSLRLGLTNPLLLTIPKGSRDNLAAEMTLVEEIHAPVTKGDKLGTLTIVGLGEKKVSVPISALNSVDEAGFLSRLIDSIHLFFLKLFDGDPLEY
ncbi:MAG: D-alanyl-D-alanine carboxypeptidase family protein [Pseudomonadota bacterium]|nr:D-alanyl-D-alanine carboxypeptidase family protein [Pseudomonadota bacterium]